jgi:glyoxylase-like metal-dependent hydrolase (beta-lactamase superfamily II)
MKEKRKMMRVMEVVPGVHLLGGLPPYAINTYVVDDVLLDAGTRFAYPLLAWQLRRFQLRVHALTHAHPDHCGSSHALCAKWNLPLWCGVVDAENLERGTTIDLLPASPSNRLLNTVFGGPPHPVARVLQEGVAIGSFEAIHTPGHTPGHLALWRAADRTLILGDVLANAHPLTQRPGLREPARRFTLDPALNRRSARKLAQLQPRLICFGHGPPLRDTAQFQAFVERLPD